MFDSGEFEQNVFAARPRKHELIIRENQPVELPPDVVRGTKMFGAANMSI